MAEFDYGGLLQSGLQLAGAIYQGQNLKRAQKIASKNSAADFPQLGMGLTASGPQRDLIFAAMPGIQSGGSSTAMAGSSSVVPRGVVYGVYQSASGAQRVYGMRSLGTPMLWSGDLAAVKRVARVARKLGRFVHRRRGKR